jgi:hypothetical protein
MLAREGESLQIAANSNLFRLISVENRGRRVKRGFNFFVH